MTIKSAIIKKIYRLYALLNLFVKEDEFVYKTLPAEQIHPYQTTYYKTYSSHENKFVFDFLSSKPTLPHHIIKIKQAKFVAESGATILGKRIVLRTLYDSKGYFTKSGIMKYLFMKKERFLPVHEKLFHLSGLMNNNFFHFVVESLPRILDYMILKKEIPELKLLVNLAQPYTRPYLNLCGVEDRDIFFAEENLQIDEIYISGNKFKRIEVDKFWARHMQSKVYLNRLIRLILKNVGVKPVDQNRKRVYISRVDSGGRKIQNEKELLTMLSPYGFESVILSHLSVAEQIKLVYGSECIIGPHGAGFTNLLYARHCVIIEIFPSDRNAFLATTLFQLSQYHHQNKHILWEEESVDKQQNMEVDLKKLEPLVKEALNPGRSIAEFSA